ncbi:MAG: radical SAM protein [Deltaproteobacteria bacterium]|nr:radical SAM protein [Deltaproteobacteria bacterium]
MVLLINPPVVRPSEPPPGIARLQGTLHSHGVRCTVWDANLEGLLNLLQQPEVSGDRWTARAGRHVQYNLDCVRGVHSPLDRSRYTRAVSDLNRLLQQHALKRGVNLSLTNYEDASFSPVKSRDLIAVAEEPQRNVFYPFLARSLPPLLERENPSLVGISLNYLSQALPTFAMVGVLRKLAPSLPLLLGGGLVTSWISAPSWRNPFEGLVHHMVAGPGETPLVTLTVGSDVKQVNWRVDYRSLPLEDYLAPGRIIPYSASSGCYWNRCSFCPERAEQTPYLPIPPERVTADLQELARRHSPALIHLVDNAISPALMEKMTAHPPGVPWYGFARFSRWLEDREFCFALRRSGCVMLQLGLESGDQRVLDLEQKGIALEAASRAIKNLAESGIGTYIYLLFGTPSETLEAARKTLDYTVAHSSHIHFLNLALFNLPRHSPEAATHRRDESGEEDLSLYSRFIHPSGWGRSQVRRFLHKEFKRHSAIAPILRNDPICFTSSHAPFFCRQDALLT